MGGLIAGGLSLVGGINAAHDEGQAAARGRLEAADNKRLALSAAADAEARGGMEAANIRQAGTQMISRQHVAYANSGVDASVGTAADVQATTRALSELDAKTAENNAAAEAWGFKRHGLQFQQQAALEAARSSSRASAHILGGAGRFVSGASQYFGGE